MCLEIVVPTGNRRLVVNWNRLTSFRLFSAVLAAGIVIAERQ